MKIYVKAAKPQTSQMQINVSTWATWRSRKSRRLEIQIDHQLWIQAVVRTDRPNNYSSSAGLGFIPRRHMGVSKNSVRKCVFDTFWNVLTRFDTESIVSFDVCAFSLWTRFSMFSSTFFFDNRCLFFDYLFRHRWLWKLIDKSYLNTLHI